MIKDNLEKTDAILRSSMAPARKWFREALVAQGVFNSCETFRDKIAAGRVPPRSS